MNKLIEITLDETKIATLQQMFAKMIQGRKHNHNSNWPKYEHERNLLNLLQQQFKLAEPTDQPETLEIETETKTETETRLENQDLTTLIKRKRALQRAIRRTQTGELKKVPSSEKLERWENELREVTVEIKTKLGYARQHIVA
jgi:DNA polymerase III gamma/tau subunit